MKSIKAVKNIRLFKNAQAGKPKRVTTGVDDYGNRFHVVGGKVKHSRSLSENKKAARKLTRAQKPVFKESNNGVRHLNSQKRREALLSISPSRIAQNKHALKKEYHRARVVEYNSVATKKAQQIHEGKRKSKDFTK